MKALKFYLFMMTVLLSGAFIDATAAGPLQAWSDADGVFYLKTNDGLEQYTVDGTITFKAVADGNTIPSYRDCGVVFSPANEGEIIQITVNSIDLSGDNYLLLYDGAIEKIGYGVGGNQGQASYLPDGFVRWFTSESVGETYTSTSEDGKLSFGFHSKSPAGQTGFNITVTSLSPKDMEYKGIEVLNNLSSTYRNAKDQAIYGVNVITDGGSNALTLDELTIDASALTGSNQVTNVRLYRGDQFTGDALLATTASVGDNLTASNVTLKSGNNKFMVVADVLPDATGDIPSLQFVSASVAGEACTPATTTGNAITIDNTILMPSEATIFTIGDAAHFYDDGGIDGKVGLNFTGTATFVPATPGHAIKVDFSKLAIFNTSTIGKNDILNFYNGRTADEANLITTLLTEAETVKSTAEDGSMTITLTSTTGVPAEGWEAMVSEFLPGDMTFAGLNVTAGTSTTVAAGDQTNMLIVDVMTDNQSNPLSLKALNLTSTDIKNINKVTAYYLGKKNVMSTANSFGHTTVTDGNITINGNQELTEGHNYLAIVLDVKNTALNGEQFDLTMASATVNESVQVPDQTVTAQCTVTNICHATKGSHSHTMYDEWTFTHTESSISPGKYEYEDADYIVTFTPAVAGKVAQLDFSKFDVTYSNTNYGTKAVFEVYSGTSVNTENLLWSLSDASQATTGPGKTLRSTAADGSMTIRFNPKTTSSYYAGSGWMATVIPFQNHAMEVESVTVNQSSTDVVPVGATDAQIIDFDVVTSGSLTTQTVTEVNLDLKEGQQNVAKVNVLYNNTNDLTTAVAFGSIETPQSSAVTVTGERALAEGDNYFWVTLDVKSDAQSEQTIDARLVSVKNAEGNIIEVANGDPEGERTIKSMLVMQSGVNVVTVTQPLMFYDDGGPDENFSKGFDGTITFVPGVENCGVEINAISFATGSSSYNKFNVYHGSVVSDENKDGGNYYATYGPTHLLSKADDGSLTITFTTSSSSYASQTAGWEIEVYLHEYKPLAVDQVTASAATTEEVVRGSVDAKLVKVEVKVDNDKESVNLNDFVFSTTGTTSSSDVVAAKLYYTGKVDNFGTQNLIATVTDYSASDITFTATEPITITENGTYYLWLALDLAKDAVAGNTVAAQLTGMSGLTDTTEVNATVAERAIKSGFHGTYTIGASADADYSTFTAAVAAMSGGIDGAVRFEVEDGQYAENIEMTNIVGTSETHNITFTSKSGNRDAVVIKGNTNTGNGGMVLIDGTSFVTLEGMSFIPTSQSYANVILVRNESRHFTLRNSYVKAEPVTSGYSGMNLVRTTSGSGDGMNNDYATIEGNTLEGGYISLYLSGPGPVAYQDAIGFVVRNNTISDPRGKSIYMMDVQDAVIDGNTISQSFTTYNNYNGMDLYRLSGAFVVSNNVVINTHSAYSNGIYLRQECQGESESRPALIYNNSVVITNSPNNNTAGLQINSDARNIHAYYNTVRVAGSGGYCFYNGNNSNRYSNIKLQNNLFQNFTTDGYVALFYDENKVKATDMRNNVLYAASGNIVKDYALTIDDLNALIGNETNTVEQATFLSDVDNHLKLAGNLLTAIPIDFITTDADGNSRNAETPTVGAYEYADVVIVTPEIAEGYPQVITVGETNANVKTKWNVSGKLYSLAQANGANDITIENLLATTPVDYTADGEQTTAFKDLTPSTDYKAYFLLVSALDDSQSEIVVSDMFTTLRHIDDLKVDFGTTGYVTVESGEEATLAPVITGGDEPYTYEWRDQMNNVVSTEATLTAAPEYTWGYKLTVTSADGQTIQAKTAIHVQGDAVTATFDDNYLPENGYFIGDCENDVFYSGSFAFNVSNMDGWWYGYGMSNQMDTTYNGLTDQYHSSAGGGVNGSQFCVAFPSGTTVDMTNDVDGNLINGVMITNSAYAYSSMKNGDSFARKFTTGDWFLLTIIGTHSDGTSSTVEAYLADLRDADTTKHYILDSWKWVDLSSLGEVKSLRFDLSSSDVGQWGMNTPAYVCIDNLGAGKPTGDINCDGVTSIVDVTTLIDYLLGTEVNPFDQEAADVNHNGSINITDVTALIDLLLDKD